MDGSIAQEGLNPFSMILLVAIMGLVPFLLTVVTSYCKIYVVISLVRNALGVQQVPPTMVLSALAMILSVFVMAPVGKQTYDQISAMPPLAEISVDSVASAADRVSGPMRSFLKANSDDRITAAFVKASEQLWPKEMQGSFSKDSLLFTVPSFVITELTKAFQIGFLLYLPFIAIDLIISNILLAMGMMMVSPMSISLPFKLMLFVTLDGWLKLSSGLMYSYSY